MGSVLYDGIMSGALIATAITFSGANVVAIPYSNGQRVIVIRGSS